MCGCVNKQVNELLVRLLTHMVLNGCWEECGAVFIACTVVCVHTVSESYGSMEWGGGGAVS